MKINVESLLRKSCLKWEGSMQALEKDLLAIINLFESLPEPKNFEVEEFHCSLAKDEYGKRALKSDLLKNDMDMFHIINKG